MEAEPVEETLESYFKRIADKALGTLHFYDNGVRPYDKQVKVSVKVKYFKHFKNKQLHRINLR
jgi:hypothetical protein